MDTNSSPELHIEIRRGEHTTVIEVTTSSLRRLDAATFDHAIEYVYFVADSEGGPWRRPNENRLQVRPKSPIGNSPRTAIDRIELQGNAGGAIFVPTYFYVSEQWIKLNKPDGEPVESNIATPSTTAFIQFPDARDGMITPSSGVIGRPLESRWVTAHVMLSLENQNADLVGAHFVVQTKDWSGHFWGPRKKGSIAYGQPGWPYGEVQIPFTRIGLDATVGGALNVRSGTGAVKLLPHPKDAESAPKLALEQTKLATAELDQLRARCEKRRTELAQHPITAAEVHTLDDVHELSIKNGLLTQVRDCDEVSIKAADLKIGAVSSESTGDWKVALNFRNKILKLLQKLPKLDEEDLARRVQELRLAIRLDNGPGKARSEEQLAKLLKTGRQERELITSQRIAEQCKLTVTTAIMAGSRETLEKAAELGLKHLRRLAELNPPWGMTSVPISKLLYQFADGLATLAGDQNTAAGLFQEAYELELAEAERSSAAAARRIRERYARNLPAWWPDGTSTPPLNLSGSVGKGGDNNEDDVRKIKQRLHDLGFTFVGPVDGMSDDETIYAIRLFQAIIRGVFPDQDHTDGLVSKGGFTHNWLEASNAPRWVKMPESGDGFVNWGYHKPDDQDHIKHLYGTNWLADAIKAASEQYKRNYWSKHEASLLTVNDASLEIGGPTPSHMGAGHQTGLAYDIKLPQKGNTGEVTAEHRTIDSNDYDQDSARAILLAFRSQALANLDQIFFNDKELRHEKLCHYKDDHHHHIHVAVKAPEREP